MSKVTQRVNCRVNRRVTRSLLKIPWLWLLDNGSPSHVINQLWKGINAYLQDEICSLENKNVWMIIYRLCDIIQTSLVWKLDRNLMNYKQDTNIIREALLWLFLLVSAKSKNCRNIPKNTISTSLSSPKPPKLLFLFPIWVCLSPLAFHILLLILPQLRFYKASQRPQSLSKKVDPKGKRNHLLAFHRLSGHKCLTFPDKIIATTLWVSPT